VTYQFQPGKAPFLSDFGVRTQGGSAQLGSLLIFWETFYQTESVKKMQNFQRSSSRKLFTEFLYSRQYLSHV